MDLSDINFEPVVQTRYNYLVKEKFSNLGVSSDLIKGLAEEAGYIHPSRVQALTLPVILSSKNLVAQGHSGSGKTACFILGMLSHADPNVKALQSLCICPTRELSLQTLDVLRQIGRFTSFSFQAITDDNQPHDDAPHQIVIGTPGAVLERISSHKMNTKFLKVLVYDETDYLFEDEYGYRNVSQDIWKSIHDSGVVPQVLLFSTTLKSSMRDYMLHYFQPLDFVKLFLNERDLFPENVKQIKLDMPDDDSKIPFVVKDVLSKCFDQQVVIFLRKYTCWSYVDELLNELRAHSIRFVLDKSLETPNSELGESFSPDVTEFKGTLNCVLITSDEPARGLDSNFNIVINLDLPTANASSVEGMVHDSYKPDFNLYLHRVGRAGRFGRKGLVLNLLSGGRENILMEYIEKHFEFLIPRVSSWIPHHITRVLEDVCQ